MAEPSTIQKKQNRASLNWEAMRSEGIKAIERYGHKVWTDFNKHDPGITLLEALCYAITDLGYRTDWPVEDLLESYSGSKILGKDFFPAQVILPNYPWTPTDFRKLIIDFGPIDWFVTGFSYPKQTLFPKLVGKNPFQLGIQNVWLLRAIPGEEHLYLNGDQRITKVRPAEKEEMVFLKDERANLVKTLIPADIPKEKGKAQLSLKAQKDAPEILLNGLYEVHLLFEENPELPQDNPLRDVNLNYHRGNIAVGDKGDTARYTLSFPYWDEFEDTWYLNPVQAVQVGHAKAIGENGKWDRVIMPIAINGNNQNVLYPELYIHLPDLVDYTHEIYASSREVKARVLNWPDMIQAFSWRIVSETGSVNSIIKPGAITEHSPFDFSLKLKHGGQSFDLKIKLLSRGHDLEPDEEQAFRDHLRKEVIAFLQMRQQAYGRAILHFNSPTAMVAPVNAYAEKLRAIYRIVEGPLKEPEKGLKSYLCGYRNLCEDWVRFRQLPIEEIGLNCELIISGGYDEREIMALAYHQIGRFLSPMVQYRSLEEMLESGGKTDDIFEGPLLRHGFIDTQDLEVSKRREEYVYTSDLLRILMNIEGVQAVNKLNISGYVDGRQVVANEPNCIELEKLPVQGMPDKWNGRRKPRLCLEFSSIALVRDEDLLNHSPDDEKVVFLKFSELEWEHRTLRIPQVYTISEPQGSDREVADWQAIQEDLPLHYGVGEEGLPLAVPDLRKAQAKQLKGFLLFFDQLLANYSSQLGNLKELFSFQDQNQSVQNSYFANPLYPTAEIQPLLAGAGTTGQDWQSFLANLGNPYLTGLWQATETESTFYDRRNRFLEHLMARFGESFTDYSLQIFALNKDQPQPWDVTRKQVIEDQKVLLRDLPVIGPQRGKGFCYKKRIRNRERAIPDVWDTENVAGVKRRICRLLGIQNFDRRHLVGAMMPAFANVKVAKLEQNFDHLFQIVNYRGVLRWRIQFGDQGQYYFEGSKKWKLGQHEIGDQFKIEIINAAQDFINFFIDHRLRSKYATIHLKEGLGTIRTRNPKLRDFLDEEVKSGLADKAIKLLIELLRKKDDKWPPKEPIFSALPLEGFHIIEHILFRPRSSKDQSPLLPVRPPYDEVRTSGRDPYSFRATVILPLWTDRFRNPSFRRYVERVIRLEMPAHIWTDIIWINDSQDEMGRLYRFEEAYRFWLEKNASYAGETSISQKLKACLKRFIELQSHHILNPPS